MTRLAGLILLAASLFYPIVVYFGLEHWSPRHLALLLATLWLGRLLGTAPSRMEWALATAMLGFCALIALTDTASLLVWYPVLINALLLFFFGSSLLVGMPVVERLARLREPQLPAVAVAYTRRVTAIWTSFFLVNGLIAALLALFGPLSWWTLYNGFIAYLLMAALMGGEWLVRQRLDPA